MSYNGTGTFQINSSGQPVVTATVITSSAFNALTADIGTGLSTCICKDGQTTTTQRIPFAQGITSTLTTDTTSTSTGSIITAGGAGIAKALVVGTKAAIGGALDANAALKLTGTSQATTRLVFSNSTWAGSPLLIDQDNSGNGTINLQANASLVIATNNSNRFIVTGAGNTVFGASIFSVNANGYVLASGDGNQPTTTTVSADGILQIGPVPGTVSGADGNAGIVLHANTTTDTSYGEISLIPGSYLAISADKRGSGTMLPISLFTNHTRQVDLKTTGLWRWYQYTSGTLVSDSSGNITVSSDERMKMQIRPFETGLAAIRKIDPILYRWNEKSGMETDGTYAGFSAQNVEKAEPYAVGRSKNTDMRSLNDRALLAMCVNAIKELDQRISG